MENQRSTLERQNKDLKEKLAELENQIRTRTKATIATLEGKVSNLEEQLDVETKSVFLNILWFWGYKVKLKQVVFSVTFSRDF